LKSLTLTGGPKLSPPSVDFTIRIWLWLSPPAATALLKFWKTTYRSPLGAVNGCGNWLALQVPAGEPSKLTGHSAAEVPLMAGTRFQVAPWSSDQAKPIGSAVKSVLYSAQAT
jgi:hypothetical protein